MTFDRAPGPTCRVKTHLGKGLIFRGFSPRRCHWGVDGRQRSTVDTGRASPFPRGMRIAVVLAVVSLIAAATASAEPASKVFINGRATPVYFNDGDSFKPLSGPFKGSQSRLAGFNTLESFGSVHSWGGWTEKEMWVIAKLATNCCTHTSSECQSKCSTYTIPYTATELCTNHCTKC